MASAEPVVKNQDLKDSLLATLNPHIFNAVVGYYGAPKQYDLFDAEILDLQNIKPGSFDFTATIRITTFSGSHNPPYGIDTIKMSINSYQVIVEKFEHKNK